MHLAGTDTHRRLAGEQGCPGDGRRTADDEDRPPGYWIVNLFDDCEGCDDLRVELVLEVSGPDERVATQPPSVE